MKHQGGTTSDDGRAEVRRSPRVPKSAIQRLYQSEASGLLDAELVDEVSLSLLLRCRDILTIAEARRGTVRCPRCEREGRDTSIPRAGRARDERIACPACGWAITWADYQRTFKRRQLHLGGAGSAFRHFARHYPKARSPREKMLLIDRLIHEFHFSLRGQPGRPTRAACVNLICRRLTDAVAFLNDFTCGDDPNLASTRRLWRRPLEAAGQWHPKRTCGRPPGPRLDPPLTWRRI